MKGIYRFFIAVLVTGWVIVPAEDIPGDKPSEKTNSIDQQVSRHVQKLAEEERGKRIDFMTIVIDDITRLCELSGKQNDKLNLAAKGAAKRSMERWHDDADRYFRTRVKGADTDTAREILSNIGTVNFSGRGSDREGEMESIWKDSLKDILTKAQIKKYDTIVEQRAQAKVDAFTQMAMASLDNYLRLTPDQKGKLGKIVQASAEEYLDQIQRYWGEYLQKGMLMSLANAADEKTLSGILSENQHSRLRTATSSLDHFWDQRRRVKKAKEKANDKKQKKGEEAPQVEAIKIGGKINAGKVVIKAGADGAVVIQPGAIFRGGDITIEGGDIRIEEGHAEE